MIEGPVLQELMQRLTEIPADFFVTPMKTMYGGSKKRELSMPALISDLLFDAGGDIPKASLLSEFLLHTHNKNLNHLRIISMVCYLYNFSWFLNTNTHAPGMYEFIKGLKLVNLSKIVDYKLFITDMERREEFVRLCLSALGLFPFGENTTLAKDRLRTLDSMERKRIIAKSRKAQERARMLREAMARQRAAEAASKMSRE